MDKFWEWFAAGLCMVGLMFAAVLCYRMLPPSTKDFWDIVAAVGSAGAAVAAVWIATRDSRRRNADEMAAARLAASGMAYRANTVANHVRQVLGRIDGLTEEGPSVRDFKICAEVLSEGGLWTHEELLPLIPLPDDCASKLAVAASQVNFAIVVMRRVVHEGLNISAQTRISQAEDLRPMLSRCLQRLESAVETCRKEAKMFASYQT